MQAMAITLNANHVKIPDKVLGAVSPRTSNHGFAVYVSGQWRRSATPRSQEQKSAQIAKAALDVFPNRHAPASYRHGVADANADNGLSVLHPPPQASSHSMRLAMNSHRYCRPGNQAESERPCASATCGASVGAKEGSDACSRSSVFSTRLRKFARPASILIPNILKSGSKSSTRC